MADRWRWVDRELRFTGGGWRLAVNRQRLINGRWEIVSADWQLDRRGPAVNRRPPLAIDGWRLPNGGGVLDERVQRGGH